jgi:hypothetical protein
VGDPWEPVTSLLVTPQIFGPGSYRMFRWYFEGQSAVQVRTVDDVCRWLSEPSLGWRHREHAVFDKACELDA